MKHIQRGLSITLRRFNAVFFLYGIQLIFALIFIFPLRQGVKTVLGASLLGGELLRGQGASFFFEWMAHHPQMTPVFITLLAILGLLYFILSLFFQGGVLESVRKNEQFGFPDFFHASARLFSRLSRLCLIFLSFLPAAFFLYFILGWAFSRIAGDSEPAQVLLFAARGTLLLIAFHLVQLAFDYAKIMTVHNDGRGMWKTAFQSFRLVFSCFRMTVPLYAFFAIAGLAVCALLYGLQHLIPISSAAGIALLFLSQQILALLVQTLRYATLASETSFFQEAQGK